MPKLVSWEAWARSVLRCNMPDSGDVHCVYHDVGIERNCKNVETYSLNLWSDAVVSHDDEGVSSNSYEWLASLTFIPWGLKFGGSISHRGVA